MKKLFLSFALFASVSVYAQPRPTANAGPDTAIFFPQHAIFLEGKGTGVGIKYKWDVYSITLPQTGNDSTAQFQLFNATLADSVSALPTNVATYVFRLTVTDMYGRKSYDYVTVKAYWMPKGVTDIINVTSVRDPQTKISLAITNSGKVYEAFEKQ